MAASSSGRLPPSPQVEASEGHDVAGAAAAKAQDSHDNGDPDDSPTSQVDIGQTTFKRKQKPSGLVKFLSPIRSKRGAGRSRFGNSSGAAVAESSDDGSLDPGRNSPKESNPLDWYAEGPGRRVGYEDRSAIDWIFEYTKERTRLRGLRASASGLQGYIARTLDSSQIWIVLIFTGLAAGLFAASIDVASDWLADIKTGFCASGDDDGKFYLNKNFCCLGHNEWAQCNDWTPWSSALHLTSRGSKWVVEYIFFVVFSVSWFWMAGDR
jgi:chloride channel 3/4/5